jgi:hypothetical protein
MAALLNAVVMAINGATTVPVPRAALALTMLGLMNDKPKKKPTKRYSFKFVRLTHN